MKKVLTAALTALTIASALGTGVTAASADEYRGRDDRHSWGGGGYDRGERHGDRDGGALIGAGILGLAIGAAIASSDRHPAPPPPVYYREPPPAYYAGPYYYGYAGECRVHYRWDSYYRRYVEIERCY